VLSDQQVGSSGIAGADGERIVAVRNLRLPAAQN